METRLSTFLALFVSAILFSISATTPGNWGIGTRSSSISVLAAAQTRKPTRNTSPGRRQTTQSPPRTVATPPPTSIPESAERNLPYYNQSVLLWPKGINEFKSKYASWELWLAHESGSLYAVRDELLVAVRASVAMIPNLEVKSDEPNSDLIVVSGNPAAVSALLERLRGDPLLARFTDDSPARRNEAHAIWVESKPEQSPVPSQHIPGVNIRTPRATNVVWGYGKPAATIQVTLTRPPTHILKTTTTSDPSGLYYAYLKWEIRDGDIVEVNDGLKVQKLLVIPLRALSDPGKKTVKGSAAPGIQVATVPAKVDVIIGKANTSVPISQNGTFTADFSNEQFLPGTPGFLQYTDQSGNRIFSPTTVSVVRIRRDTSYGLPYGDTHSGGGSSIVWGYASPNTTLSITLSRSGNNLATRSTQSDQFGSYSVSVDNLIKDGDVVQVSDGSSTRTVQVPVMTFQVDAVARTITGIAPANITSTSPGSPHSLQITIGGNSRWLTTTGAGEYSADFSSNPYLPGLLGGMSYSTPDGDNVYKPLFAADPLARDQLGDWRADIIIGQPDIAQITPNEVVGNRVFNPFGTLVDRSVRPNRIYVFDSGNSRILGLRHLGVAQGGPDAGQPCTSNSDHPNSTCQIQSDRAADIVLGQPSPNSSSCNSDSAYQEYPDVPMATANSLCGLREEQLSILEGGSGATMATDSQGNLYVPDTFNNRVLRYNTPFASDSIADYVWGQADFAGIHCNRGAGMFTHTDAKSFCLMPAPGIGEGYVGVAIDSGGNLWVADNQNNRVLRFPFNPGIGAPDQEADLVLGQPDFSSLAEGTSLGQMRRPSSVRVGNNGDVYVADALNNRILVFSPPFSNGMFAARLLGSGLSRPLGLEIDPNGGIWVNDVSNNRIVHFTNEVQDKTISLYDVAGGIGNDIDNNILVAISGYPQEAYHYSAPTYSQDAKFLRTESGSFNYNHTGSRSVTGGIGLEVAAGQLIYADADRMLFWNNPWNLSNGQAASGVIGQPNFQSRGTWPPIFGRMRADKQGRLWVLFGGSGILPRIYGYRLPLQTGATPDFTITSPLPLQGGGVFTWTEGFIQSGIDVQANCDCLWLSDTDSNRAFRIRNISTNPFVDIVLGQKDNSGIHCNQGRDPDEGIPQFPSQDSLCHPGALAFDRNGNLFLADHNLEFRGNWRLLEFDANTLPDAPSSTVFGIPASHVFGRNDNFTDPNCSPAPEDPMCGPWEPTFDSQGRMVIGLNGYLGLRFPMVYQNPLTSPLPIAALGDVHAMPLSARFDQFDNLYILDHNRMRILIYRNQQVQTYTVSGTIRTASGNPISGVKVDALGYAASAISDGAGSYTLTGMVAGSYQIVPSKNNYGFTPAFRTITVPDITNNQDFVGQLIATSTSTPTRTTTNTATNTPTPTRTTTNTATNTPTPTFPLTGMPTPSATPTNPCVAKPEAPSLKSPVNNATLTISRPILKWRAANCAKTYKIIVKSAVTGKAVDKKGRLSATKYKTEPLPNARYQWFVKACNNIGCSKSPSRFFTVKKTSSFHPRIDSQVIAFRDGLISDRRWATAQKVEP